MQRKWYFPNEWKIHFSNRRWTKQTFWRKSGTENTHFDTGTPNSWRKSQRFSWIIRRISCTTSRLFSGCQWSNKWLLVHVRKLHRTAISLNPESNFTRREKNHSLFHWNTLMYPELLIRIWMSSKRNASMILGISMGLEICLIHGQVSLKFTLLEGKPPDGYMWSGERLTRKQMTSRPDHLWPDLWTKFWKESPAEGEAQMVRWITETRWCQKITRNLCLWPWGQGVQRNHWEGSKEIGNTSGSRYALQY